MADTDTAKAIELLRRMGACLELAVDPEPGKQINPAFRNLVEVAAAAVELRTLKEFPSAVGAMMGLDKKIAALDAAIANLTRGVLNNGH